MKRSLLLWYHILTGFSDTTTGLLLLVAPALTLRLMSIHAPTDAMPYLSLIGVFVLSVGLASVYGVRLVACGGCERRLQTIWMLTAITRSMVAVFVFTSVLAGSLEAGWLTVAGFDAACAGIQTMGLRRGWLSNAGR